MFYWSPELWNQAVNLAAAYWIVPVGLVALAFYGSYHFNTPDYALAAERAGSEDLPWNAPTSKLRGLAPPLFTTSRTQYRRYELRYILILQGIFLVITCLPDVIVYAGKITNLPFSLSEYVQQRGLWALFGLTGFLSSFPVAKEIDSKARAFLHRSADIPDGAELTASTLFEADFAPDPAIRAGLVKEFRTKHMRWVAAGAEPGSLESKWLKTRCLQIELKGLLKSPRCNRIRRALQTDLDEMELLVARVRDRMIEYCVQQDQLIPERTSDLDEYIADRIADERYQQLHAKRKVIEFDTDALFFRMCRFATVVIYASESRPEAMNEVLKGLGFQVTVIPIPPWDLDAIFKVGASILAALMVPSALYMVLMRHYEVVVPEALRVYVPQTGEEVLAWALTGVVLYVATIVLALRIKRGYARSAARGVLLEHPENLVIGLVCYGVLLCYLVFAALAFGSPLRAAFLWALLPGTVGYFAGKYIDKAMLGRSPSLRRPAKQAAIMAVLAGWTCMFMLPDALDPTRWTQAVAWFTFYCTVTAGTVGLTIGVAFQYLYSHRGFAPNARVTPESAQRSGRRVIGDFILEKVVSTPEPVPEAANVLPKAA
jgi:hypothetical protein